MAVVIETTLGDITVDLYLEQRPVTCLNFLKLCKMKYYNYNLFHTIRSGFIAQTGDPSGEGSGGQSIWGILEGPQKRFFSGEKMPKIRHTDAGLLSMVCTDDMMVGSQFFITLAPDLDSLDGTHCVIGEVTEGHEVLTKLNEVICDETHRPYRDVRITHTVVLEDPFNDPPGLRAPSRSPSPNAERLKGGRIAPDEEVDETQGKSAEEIQEMIEEKEAKARATILEIVGDLPDAEIAPPENVLFVCKLNPVTTDEDLEIIFSRFGKIVSCEVIRDKKTGNSLQYAFIEFENKKSCEDAYFKMDNVLIDDRRIHVDFSQSVSKMRWLGKGRGVQYFDDDKQMPQPIDRQRQHDRRHNKDEHNNRERQYDRNENRRDRDQRSERERTNNKQHKDRSRSRSRLEHSRYKHSERESDRDSKENSKYKDNKYRDSQKYDNYDNYKNKHSSSHRSRLSTNYNDSRETSKSPRRYNDKLEYKKKSLENKNDKNSSSSYKSQIDKYNSKRSNDEDQSQKLSKKEKNVNNHKNPKPPSPEHKRKKENKNKTKDADKKVTKKYISKKKRKPSTSSSDTDSSETSSSSDSSSSSEDDKRKKRSRKKRRKYSTSSSSSDTSSSNSSSSTDSDTSSSSDDERSKKKGKKAKKKSERKTKKKL